MNLKKNNLTKPSNLGERKGVRQSKPAIIPLDLPKKNSIKKISDQRSGAVEKKKTQAEILDENADEVIDLIRDNVSYRAICERFGVHIGAVVEFTNNSDHSARALAAKKQASYDLIEKAESEIRAIKDFDPPAAVRRQVELMNIAIYKAKVKNREEFDLNYREKDVNNQQVVVVPAPWMTQLPKVNQ